MAERKRQRRNKRVIGNALGVLDANEGNLAETAEALSVPKSTLKWWRDNYSNDEVVARHRTLKNAELADRFRVISALATERLISEIHLVKVDNLATTAAIGADKQLLLTGQATAITADQGASSAKFAAILKDIGIELPPEKLQEMMAASFARAGITDLGKVG